MVLVYGPEQMRAGLLKPLDDMVEENDIDLTNYVQSIVEPGDEFSCATRITSTVLARTQAPYNCSTTRTCSMRRGFLTRSHGRP